MQSWSALLEALHSALIDELNSAYPKWKPELGLPQRQSAADFPSEDAAFLLSSQVELGGQAGAVFMACSAEFEKTGKCKLADLFERVRKRASAEFERRSIRPVFAKFTMHQRDGKSRHSVLVSRVIWMPMKLQGAPLFLGVGIQ